MRAFLFHGNRLGRYFLYAGGEVVLVVLGILIALGINNWHEKNKLKSEEAQLLENLKIEFALNLDKLEEIRINNSNIYSSTDRLKKLIGSDNSTIEKHNIDSLLFVSILISDYQPNQFILSQIKSSDKLKIISSDLLKRYLYEWDNAVNSKTEAFNMLNTYFMNSFIPFLDKNVSVRNMDYYGDFHWSAKTPLEYDNAEIFSMIQFDNHLENHIWCINSFNESVESLIKICKKIDDEIQHAMSHN